MNPLNILITGAGKGLGLELVKKFSDEPGNKIIAVSRNLDQLYDHIAHGKKDTLNFSEIIPYHFDLIKRDYQELAEMVSLHMGHLDILINNAGYLVHQKFIDTTEKEYETTFDTNVKAVFKTIQALYPFFYRNTHIVNITSMGGFQGSVKFPGLSVYSASKAAVAGLTQCLAAEFAEQGITVNALALGSVQTEMLAKAFPGYQSPVKTSEMAEYVAGFARNGKKYCNGQIIPVALSTP